MLSFILSAAIRFETRSWVILAVVVLIVFFATSGRKLPRRCSRCQEVNRDQAIYCAQCGTRLSEKK